MYISSASENWIMELGNSNFEVLKMKMTDNSHLKLPVIKLFASASSSVPFPFILSLQLNILWTCLLPHEYKQLFSAAQISEMPLDLSGLV